MVFDKERSDKIGNEENKRDDFLGEKLFNLIHENQIIKRKNEESEITGKITGMILGIENFEEIVDILESPSKLEGRMIKVLELHQKNKQFSFL